MDGSNRISMRANFFDLGGDSILLIQLYRAYTAIFEFDTSTAGIAELFKNPTITDHARLISQSSKNKVNSETNWFWPPPDESMIDAPFTLILSHCTFMF